MVFKENVNIVGWIGWVDEDRYVDKDIEIWRDSYIIYYLLTCGW